MTTKRKMLPEYARVRFADFTSEENELLRTRIIPRAAALFVRHGTDVTALHSRMNLSAAHARCPLDIAALAKFDDANFAHDIFGIERHLDKTTGKLLDFFVPRCAAKAKVSR